MFGGVMQVESDDCEDQDFEVSQVYSVMQARGGFGGGKYNDKDPPFHFYFDNREAGDAAAGLLVPIV